MLSVDITKTSSNNCLLYNQECLQVVYIYELIHFTSCLQHSPPCCIRHTTSRPACERLIAGYLSPSARVCIYLIYNTQLMLCLTNINIFRVDIQLYQHEWKLGKREIVWKHDARRAECFHTISSFPNFHECWYNCISIRKKCFIFVL